MLMLPAQSGPQLRPDVAVDGPRVLPDQQLDVPLPVLLQQSLHVRERLQRQPLSWGRTADAISKAGRGGLELKGSPARGHPAILGAGVVVVVALVLVVVDAEGRQLDEHGRAAVGIVGTTARLAAPDATD